MKKASAASRPIRIGLLGGSFNPAHAGHVHVSLEALKRLELNEVWWLVSPKHPLKPAKDFKPLKERLSYATKLAEKHVRIKVSAMEKKIGTHYTRDTVAKLQILYPDICFVWLMGADNFIELPKWHRWEELMQLIPIAIFDRVPYQRPCLSGVAAIRFKKYRLKEQQVRSLALRDTPCWCYLRIRPHPASSTTIRNALEKNQKKMETL